MLGQNTDQGVDDGLGHGKAAQRRLGPDARRIAFGNDLAVLHHDHRVGSAQWRRRGLLKGVIERGLQSGVCRFDRRLAGNLRQQRRRFRCLQRGDIAFEKVGLGRPMPNDAAETVVKLGTAAKQPGE